MKRVITLFLLLALVFSFTACGGGNKKAFEASKLAYDSIDVAYEITEQFGSDVYEAWRMAIYEDEEILENGSAHLATELNLSKEEIIDGGAYLLAGILDRDWDNATETEKDELRDMVDDSFEIFEDDLFSFCVMVVSNAYIVNGEVEKAQAALDEAKGKMKELSENYSDYEHYPNLKGYYTTTSSFFDFCQNPTGSFEQIKTTVNDYKNEARDYISDLDYIFED